MLNQPPSPEPFFPDRWEERAQRQLSGLRLPSAFEEYRGAIELVARATLWAMRFEQLLGSSGDSASSKSDASPVTAADLALQAFLVLGLRERYGEIPVVGEESTAVFSGPAGESLRQRVHEFVRLTRPHESDRAIDDAIEQGAGDGRSSQHWVIDPIDGTRGYLRGQQYCVCLALIRDQVPILGLAGCPRLGRQGWLVGAVRGGGARRWDLDQLDGEPIEVKASEPIREAVRKNLIACESSEATDRAKARLRRIGELLATPLVARPMESQCKFVLVATGDADLAVRLASRERERNRDMVWDYAGAVVFADESGAVMTDCDGATLLFGRGRQIDGNRGILCAAPWLHGRAVEACRATDLEWGIAVGGAGGPR
jgi:3'(2'), 5'-bisphosphate nucleotidase